MDKKEVSLNEFFLFLVRMVEHGNFKSQDGVLIIPGLIKKLEDNGWEYHGNNQS